MSLGPRGGIHHVCVSYCGWEFSVALLNIIDFIALALPLNFHPTYSVQTRTPTLIFRTQNYTAPLQMTVAKIVWVRTLEISAVYSN